MSYDPYDVGNIENVNQPRIYCGPQNEYEELSLLGKGAYGKVFLVTNRLTHEEFALKRIQVPVGREGVPQSVLREIATMKNFSDLHHPNVLKLHEVFHNIVHTSRRQSLIVSMVVEKCEWDLYFFLRALPRDMPETQTKMLAKQIFSGVDYLHSMNIVHRDIKPQNILVNRDLTVKLADFGLTRHYGGHSSFTTVVVTLWYRSPELLLQCSYNSSIDIWSVGCILSELYARNPLFPGSTEAQQLKLIFQKMGTPPQSDWPQGAIIDHSFYAAFQPQSFDRINPKMSPEAIALILRCLEFNPHSRCTAAEALEDPYFTTGENVILH